MTFTLQSLKLIKSSSIVMPGQPYRILNQISHFMHFVSLFFLSSLWLRAVIILADVHPDFKDFLTLYQVRRATLCYYFK